jgi:hypothetical protein
VAIVCGRLPFFLSRFGGCGQRVFWGNSGSGGEGVEIWEYPKLIYFIYNIVL